MTADELLAIARKGRPNVRYEKNKNESIIAAFDTSLGRFIAVAYRLILPGDPWVSSPGDILINGKPMYQDSDFTQKV